MFPPLCRALPVILAMTACSAATRIDHTATQQYPLGTPGYNQPDSDIYYTVLPYKLALDSEMDVALGVSEQVMEKGQPEGLLGNFVADLSLAEANLRYHPADGHGIDCCFLNNGGLRAELPKGTITKRKIFEVMPFENELVVLTIDGATMQRLLDFMAGKGGVPVSGLRFRIAGTHAESVMIGGKPFDSTATYKVVTSDYLANGGDNLFFLAAAQRRDRLDLKIRDAMISYIAAHPDIKVTTDQRISHEQ